MFRLTEGVDENEKKSPNKMIDRNGREKSVPIHLLLNTKHPNEAINV